MRKIRNYLIYLLVMIMVLTFTACGQDPKPDDSENPSETEALAEGEIAKNVFHESFDVTSTENGNTVSAQALTFNPADGYMPLVYVTYAGWAQKLETQYEKAAEERWGYDVVGVINGSFFSMDDGTLNGIIITDGRITCAHTGFSGEMVTFGKDGSMSVTKSALEYQLSINGKEYENALYYFNKKSPAGSVSDKIYYWDSACGGECDATEAGYELIFNKVNNSELSVGGTLMGELVSVTETTEETKGSKFADDQFVLYCKTSSPFAKVLKDLKPGTQVRIDVEETIAESKEIMENCTSAITNVGWLVKDGEDLTQTQKVIGTHSVTLEARWTAFGTKPDGSYVFFTSEGASTGESGSITLRDVAKTMMDLGCTNVIRMDGGGSSAMYLCDAGDGKPGYVQLSDRAVSDCIMVVKRSSMEPSKELQDSLEEAITSATALYDKTKNEEIKVALDYADDVIKNNATEGDYKKAYMKLWNAVSYIEEFKKLVASAEKADKADYTEYAYTHLTDAIQEGKTLLDNNGTKEELMAGYNDLLYWYTLTGEVSVNVAAGATYTTSIDSNPAYPDKDNKELTDGNIGDAANTNASSWAGYNGIDAGSGQTYDVIVDLGEVKAGLNQFTVNAHQQHGWGIQVPGEITVYVSDNGNTWTKVGSYTVPSEIVEDILPGGHTFTVAAEEEASARYVKYALTPAGQFIFISEVTAEVNYK